MRLTHIYFIPISSRCYYIIWRYSSKENKIAYDKATWKFNWKQIDHCLCFSNSNLGDLDYDHSGNPQSVNPMKEFLNNKCMIKTF